MPKKGKEKTNYLDFGEFTEDGAYTYSEMFDDFGVDYRKKKLGPDSYKLLVSEIDLELARSLEDTLDGDYYSMDIVAEKLGIPDGLEK